MSSRHIDTDIRNRLNPDIMNALRLLTVWTKCRAKTLFISIHNYKHEFMINNIFMNLSLLHISLCICDTIDSIPLQDKLLGMSQKLKCSTSSTHTHTNMCKNYQPVPTFPYWLGSCEKLHAGILPFNGGKYELWYDCISEISTWTSFSQYMNSPKHNYLSRLLIETTMCCTFTLASVFFFQKLDISFQKDTL